MEYDELLRQGLIDVVMSADGEICYVRDINRVGDYNIMQALKVILFYHRDRIVVVKGLATSDFFYINQSIALTDRYLSVIKRLWTMSECDVRLLSPQDFWSDYPGDYFNAFGRLAWLYTNERQRYIELFGNHEIKELYLWEYVKNKLTDGYNNFGEIMDRCRQLGLPNEIKEYLKLYVSEDWISPNSSQYKGKERDWLLSEKDKLNLFED